MFIKILIVWFQKISIPPPQRVLEIPRRRDLKRPKFLKESMSLNWHFQRDGGFKPKKPSMDIFWNNTRYFFKTKVESCERADKFFPH